MIEHIKPSHSMADYMACVEDLMNPDTPQSSIKDFYHHILFTNKDYKQTYVYTIDNKILGTYTILFERKLRYMHPKAYIEDVAVHPDHRGTGIGKELIKHAIGVAEDRKCYKIALSCTDNLQTFYEELGFKKDVNFMVKTDLGGYNKV